MKVTAGRIQDDDSPLHFLNVTRRSLTFLVTAASLSLPTPGLALPFIDAPEGLTGLSTNYVATIFPDSDDPDLFYLPYTRLQIVPSHWDASYPEFSFAYSPHGALLSLTVKPTLDRARLEPQVAAIKARRPQARFRPLPIDAGRYVPTLRMESALDTLLPDRNAQLGLEQNFPEMETPFSFFFDRNVADQIVTALNTGAAFGINYSYRFRAKTIPFSARVDVRWQAMNLRLASYRTLQTTLSVAAVGTLVRELQANQQIEVTLSGQGSALLPLIQEKINRIVIDRCFIPIDASGSVSLGGYRARLEGCSSSLESFEIAMDSTEEFTAMAGFQLGGMCGIHSALFHFAAPDGSVGTGCPSSTYGSTAPMEALPRPAAPLFPEVPVPVLSSP